MKRHLVEREFTPEGPRRFEISGPFESDDGDVLTGWALDGRGIVLKPIFEVADYLRAEFNKRNIVLLGRYIFPENVMWSKKKLTSLADIAGQKIRVISPEQAEFIKVLGGIPVTLGTGFAIPPGLQPLPAFRHWDPPDADASLRSAEDALVDRIIAPAAEGGAALLLARHGRAWMDLNREPWELDPGMFDGPLPPWVNTSSPRVGAGLGTIPRMGAAETRRAIAAANAAWPAWQDSMIEGGIRPVSSA